MEEEIVQIAAMSTPGHLRPTRFRRNSSLALGERLPSNSSSAVQSRRDSVAVMSATNRSQSPKRQRKTSVASQPSERLSDVQPGALRARVFGMNHGKGRWIISPSSPFAQFVLYLSTFLLLYTSMVVPVVIAFFWDNPDPCWRNPLLPVDIFVDTFFLVEIVIRFRTGTHVSGVYTEDPRTIAWKYASGEFLFDLATSIPVSWIELAALQHCGADAIDHHSLRFARLVKPLRLVRLIKVLRSVRDLAVIGVFERFFRIPPIAFRLLRVVFNIACVTHFVSCLFWFTKVVSNEPGEVAEFLESHGLPAEASLAQKYVVSTYFTCTVFTTVGFGDISATNTSEQLLCIAMMLLGVMVFGTLLSEVEGGIFEMRKFAREKNHILYQLKSFLRHKEVSSAAERNLLQWVAFEVDVQQRVEWEEECQRFFSPAMREAIHLNRATTHLASIEVLDLELSPAQQQELYGRLWHASSVVTFQKGQTLAGPAQPLEGMFLIEQGSVRVEGEAGLVQLLNPGEVLGDCALIGDRLAESEYGMPVTFTANSHVCCAFFSADDFSAALDAFPGGHAALAEKAARRLMAVRGMLTRSPSTGTTAFHLARARWLSLSRKLRAKAKLHPTPPTSIGSLAQLALTRGPRAPPSIAIDAAALEAAAIRDDSRGGQPKKGKGGLAGAGLGIPARGNLNNKTNKHKRRPRPGGAMSGAKRRSSAASGSAHTPRARLPNAAAQQAGWGACRGEAEGGQRVVDAPRTSSDEKKRHEKRRNEQEEEDEMWEEVEEGGEQCGGGEAEMVCKSSKPRLHTSVQGRRHSSFARVESTSSVGGGGRGGGLGAASVWLDMAAASGLWSSFALHRKGGERAGGQGGADGKPGSGAEGEGEGGGLGFRVADVPGERVGPSRLGSGRWRMEANSDCERGEAPDMGRSEHLAGEVERLSGELSQVRGEVTEILSILRDMARKGGKESG